ncbi:MAG: LysR family transcriptional regulator [Alphaproteobacteria bacterium]|nr:LysR family transcriptional regulator [Alphaproteobacteria bacterium]
MSSVSLSALRAFEAAARHLSFTRAGLELSVTQAAISHQVKALEERLGLELFRRTPRGLVLTDEGRALMVPVGDTFERLSRALGQFEGGRLKEVLTVGAVGTFAVGWLLERLPDFQARHPAIDLRLLTNNNKVDLAGESLDYAIKFGDGAWHGIHAEKIMAAPCSAVCSPQTARRLRAPQDLSNLPLLRSYRASDWPNWLDKAGVPGIAARGPLFDSSWIMVQAALRGEGVALVPVAMFRRELDSGLLVQPFEVEADLGSYWLTRLMSRPPSAAMTLFRDWLLTAP